MLSKTERCSVEVKAAQRNSVLLGCFYFNGTAFRFTIQYFVEHKVALSLIQNIPNYVKKWY
jgi:hypothetical protein